VTAATARGAAPADAEVWLSVQDASAMLGVSPATLRRWSAAGEVDAYTTPGGHRRFALSTLRALLARPDGEHVALASPGESPERLIRVLRRNARAAGRGSPWMRALDTETRDALRRQSGVLTEGLFAALTATDPGVRRDALLAAEAAAGQLGAVAAAHGATLVESVQLFVRFRALVLAEFGSVAIRRGLATSDATSLLVSGGAAADRLLTVFIAGHSGRADTPA
jgi:excisionase family DNA binding protein